MGESVTATELRQHIYRLLDHVIETGEPLDITRKGHHLRLVANDPGPRDIFDRITGNPDVIVGDPEDLVHMDWSSEWDVDKALNP